MPIAAGLHYYFHEAGSVARPPLVLIHGAGGDHLSWPPETRHLPASHVFTLDLPGHGKAEGLGRQSIEEYARSVIDFMDAAGLSRAVFGGHAMGGAVALILSIDYPERVAGTVLVSTGPRLPIPASVLENGASPFTLPLALNILQELSSCSKTPASVRDTFFKRLMEIRRTVLFGDWLACTQFDVTDQLKVVRAPTLVICGKEDKFTPLHFSQALASGIPGAALQTVDEAGHMLIFEQPRYLAQLMNIFLERIPYSPGM